MQNDAVKVLLKSIEDRLEALGLKSDGEEGLTKEERAEERTLRRASEAARRSLRHDGWLSCGEGAK